ncbi:MAG TPA: S-layer homology domain-containing protein, partial [Symbiobacteriaceae bacterium]|nr:S-layer homology domain-containing protein [Symbiobacteriaceae bacterium]
ATVTVTIRERSTEAPGLTITVTVTETNGESVVVSGTASPGATVTVGGVTVQADANGRWSATVPLQNGTNEITAISDGVSRTITVVRDSTPPPLTLTASALTTDKETVELTAISEPGATIEIGGVYGGTRTAKLALGLNTFTATATDAAGNKTTATITVERVARVLFIDVTGHWAEATINRMADLDIAWGYADSTFRPDAPVTRLDFAVMIAKLLKLAPTAEPLTFTDLGEIPAWTRGPLAAALKAGIIKGRGAGLFDPYAPITRAEVAVMMTRALTYAGKDVTPGDASFTDGDQIPDWARDHVKAAARYKLITGYEDGSFRPGNTTTRAEAVTLLSRLLDATAK